MNIIVCVKQVPGSTHVEIDEETGILRRDGVASKLNPYDLFALETALALRNRYGGTVKALSMGPMQAKRSLEEAIWMGADEGLLLSDRQFGGADVAATSYTLSLGVRSLGAFDLILCGKQTTDGDTAQVGPELAETLGLEHASNVLRIDAADGQSVTVTVDLDDCLQTQRMLLPCLLAVDKDLNTPRLPSYRRKTAFAGGACIRVCTAAELDRADPARMGLSGSYTQVERIFPPEIKADTMVLEGTNAENADKLYDLLTERKFV